MTFIRTFNTLVFLLFFLCYFYQIVYAFIRFTKKMPTFEAKEFHKFAIVISARNEQAVIGELLESINNQKYPKDRYQIIVVADNCTDSTAAIARAHGAMVFERFNRSQIGKGYALDYLFKQLEKRQGINYYDGYMVFDADNILDENYLNEMNKVFDQGYNVVTSYRNSKNYDSNWISAGYALWFLRESKYLNGARMINHTSCAISGTGFVVSSKIIEKNGGWIHHLLTEDIEFTVDNVVQGEVFGYCESAILYDEQPTTFHSSWTQRMRWTKGFYQVFANYGGKLIKGTLHKSFQCFDMLMTIAPATILTLLTLLGNGIMMVYGSLADRPLIIEESLFQMGVTFAGVYLSLFLFGLITIISEWKQIHCVGYRKVMYLFTFPIFMFSYLPIAIAAFFKKVTWEPINHSIIKNVSEIRS